MQVRLSDPVLTRDLVRYLRARHYLAVDQGGAIVAVPINAISERADVARFKRDLAEWQAEYPGVLASVALE